MRRLDAPELDVDPGAFAVGAPEAEGGGPAGPACQMAKLSYRTALGFRIVFTLLVVAVSAAAAASLVWAVYKIAKDGADVGAIVLGVTGVVESGATIFLVGRMNESIRVERAALAKVAEHCGLAL